MATERDASFLPALRFRRLTPYFDAWVRVTTRERAFKERLLAELRPTPGQRVLDVGAGTGTLALEIARRFPGVAVTGLDADPDVLAIAREKAAAAGADVELVEAMSDGMPFASGSFDAVVSTLFFHHLRPPAKRDTLREIHRVLRPGGRLHVGDFTRPADPLQAVLHLSVRAFDGFEPTADNARGTLPGMFAEAGMRAVTERARLRSPIGTLAVWTAER